MLRFSDERGLSLLEIMVTMFMVAMISCSLMGGFIISNKMIKQAEQETMASNYAYTILENLRARPAQDWMDIASGSKDGNDVSDQISKGNYSSNMQASVSLYKNSNDSSLYNVKVTVTWEEGGARRALEMVTLLDTGLREKTI